MSDFANDFQKRLRDSAKRYGMSDKDIEQILSGDAETLEPIYDCHTCHDIGAVHLSNEPRRLGEPLQWEYCPEDCAKAQARRRAEEARFAESFKDIGVPLHYQDARLETWLERYNNWTPKQQEGKLWPYLMAHEFVLAKSRMGLNRGLVDEGTVARYAVHLLTELRRSIPIWVQDLADSLENNRATRVRHSIVLSGGFGTGKTYLAAAIANELPIIGIPVRFVTVRQMFDAFKTAWEGNASEQDILAEYHTAPVLVIDDMNMESAPHPYQREYMRNIIRVRHDNQRPLIITTNLSQEAFRKHWDGGLAHVLLDMAHWITVAGDSLRDTSIPEREDF